MATQSNGRGRPVSTKPRSTSILLLTLSVLITVLNSSDSLGSTKNLSNTQTVAVANGAWPQFHGDSYLDGTSTDSLVSSDTVGKYGIKWMTNTSGPALSSPVVAWNSTLGTSVAYVGNENGFITSINAQTGALIWSQYLGSPIHSTPLVAQNGLWVGTSSNPTMYKLDLTTGAILCDAALPATIEASPVYGDPNGNLPTVYIGLLDNGVVAAPMVALNALTCSQRFASYPYPAHTITGTWDPASYGVNANGRALVLFGTADPDSSIYAIDAITGSLVWRVNSLNPIHNDFGAGISISPPGNNGFSNGMAYAVGKDGYLYAIDLTTGKVIWTYYFQGVTKGSQGSRSTAAIAANSIVFGVQNGVMSVNATTGTLNWYSAQTSAATTEVYSSPLISGSSGQQVVFVADLGGDLTAYDFNNGAQLWTINTGSYIVASAADYRGNFLITSSNGFMYDLGPNGASPAIGSTTITSPSSGSTLANPDGNITISGTATDAVGITTVQIEVQEGGAQGQFWNTATNTLQTGAVFDDATLSNMTSTTANWALQIPVEMQGSVFQVTSYETNTAGVSNASPAVSSFSVLGSKLGPHLSTNHDYVNLGRSIYVTGGGFEPGETVNFTIDGLNLGSALALANNSIPSTALKIPTTGLNYGLYSLIATGTTSKKTAQTPLHISNSWTQRGLGPLRNGFQEGDLAFGHQVSPSQNLTYSRFWMIPMGSMLSTSPIVGSGIAYFAASNGQVDAVDSNSGNIVWQTTLQAEPLGSPALGSDVIVFMQKGGSLTGYNARTGQYDWTYFSGASSVSSPLVVGNTLFISTSAHTVQAINLLSGKLIWSEVLDASSDLTPALANAGKSIVTGDDSGHLYQFNLQGTLEWIVPLYAGIHALSISPAGDISVATANNKLFLLNLAGLQIWHQVFAAQIETDPITIGKYIYVSSGDQEDEILQSTGTTVWTATFPSAIVGHSAAPGIIFTTTSTGSVYAMRTSSTLIYRLDLNASTITTPVPVNNALFVGGGDGNAYCLTPFGEPAA